IYFFSWLNLMVALEYIWLILIFILFFFFVVSRWRYFFFRTSILVTRIGAIFFLLALINVSVAFIKLQPESLTTYSAVGTNQPTRNKVSKARVVWIIFDELDERVAFVDRPKEVKMPALKKFRAEGIVAINAQPPGDVTLYSMPGLFQGKFVDAAHYTEQDNLMLNFRDGSRILWTDSVGIIQKVKSLGMDIALLAQGGHAYCRLFAKYLSSCAENGRIWTSKHRNLFDGIKNVLLSVFEHIPLVYRLTREKRVQEHQNLNKHLYNNFIDNVNRVLADPIHDLVIIHWNLPHRPFIYDYQSNEFSDRFSDENPANIGSPSGYLGNLELTDIAFSAMRRALERKNLWDSSAVIVSSDHRWRQAEQLDGITSKKVPLMIKLPGQKASKIISKKVTAINSANLVWGLLTGHIKNTEEVIQAILVRK
ncbi:MAG: sulfatase-like hydrolase/transferase, partial [Pseudomonadota bacterium]|nr:sulfatase-like hydrolase/transferase [Pseudomonadota bacterium]